MKTWTCKVCGEEISAQFYRTTKLYCSPACARKAHRLGVYNQEDKRRRVMSDRVRLSVYLKYQHSCACCGFSMVTPESEYASIYQYAIPDAIKLLPKQMADQLKKNLHGASGGCEIHHIKPLSEDGDNLSSNLILLCPNCHKKVHAGVISREQLLNKRALIPDAVLERACYCMVADVAQSRLGQIE